MGLNLFLTRWLYPKSIVEKIGKLYLNLLLKINGNNGINYHNEQNETIVETMKMHRITDKNKSQTLL